MESTVSRDRLLEGVAWRMLLVWWGLSFVPHFLPNGLDAAGTGIILLGVNAVRWFLHVPVRGFSVGFGILTLVWGVLDMGRSVLHLDYRPPVLAILLALAGIIILVGAIRATVRPAARTTAAAEGRE
jgi:hypothetical protein